MIAAWLLAVVCWSASVALWYGVASKSTLGPLDELALDLRGRGYPLAVAFTRLGRWYGVVAVTLVALAAGAVLHTGPLPIVALFAAQVLTQGAVNALKPVFRRDRPDDPLHRFERGFSYPSGHAATAILFFGGLLLLVVQSSSPSGSLKVLVAVFLGACILGIPWSRLALGAHYLSDVVGGALLGGGCLAALVALARAFASVRL